MEKTYFLLMGDIEEFSRTYKSRILGLLREPLSVALNLEMDPREIPLVFSKNGLQVV